MLPEVSQTTATSGTGRRSAGQHHVARDRWTGGTAAGRSSRPRRPPGPPRGAARPRAACASRPSGAGAPPPSAAARPARFPACLACASTSCATCRLSSSACQPGSPPSPSPGRGTPSAPLPQSSHAPAVSPSPAWSERSLVPPPRPRRLAAGPDPVEVLLGQQPVRRTEVPGQNRPPRQVEPGRHQVVVDLGVGGADPGARLVRADARGLGPFGVGPQQVTDVVDEHAAQLRRRPGRDQLRIRPHPPALVHPHGPAARLGVSPAPRTPR